MTPRSELGRLRAAVDAYGEQMILWQQAADDDRHTHADVLACRLVAIRQQRKAIIERVRKLIKAAERRGVKS